MSFYRVIINYLRTHSIPVFKSFFKAYKDTTTGPRNNENPNQSNNNSTGGGQSSGKRHPLDDFMKKFLSKTNLSAPPLDNSTALKILNIEITKQKQLEAKQVLERYYTLYKKNDPALGGTAYLQSKIFVAKEALMTQFPNAVQAEQAFYKQVVQPQEKLEKQKKEKQQQEQNKKKQINNKKEKQNTQGKQK